MKVSELIEELKKMPQDGKVSFLCGGKEPYAYFFVNNVSEVNLCEEQQPSVRVVALQE